MNRKRILLSILFIAVFAFVAFYLSSACDADDLNVGFSAPLDNPFLYDNFFPYILTGPIVLRLDLDVAFPESQISYLEMHETSPPVVSA